MQYGQQELDSQLDELTEAGCEPVFAEKISTRIRVRPEFAKAMDYARTIKQAVPHQRVIFTVHEIPRTVAKLDASLGSTGLDLHPCFPCSTRQDQ
ncbi:hypothetical protein ACQPZZ_13140 [Microbispora sp. CA-135349]|uniref:hypothetical protein n=1 Tax=Microbispora sp. CA-135349 TaxID=3239953 RepID=UPI003D8A573A